MEHLRRLSIAAIIVSALSLAVTACAPADDVPGQSSSSASASAAASTSATESPTPAAVDSITAIMLTRPTTYEQAIQLTEQLMSAVERDCIGQANADEVEGLQKAYELDMAVLEAEVGPFRTNTNFVLSLEPIVIQVCLDGKSPHTPASP